MTLLLTPWQPFSHTYGWSSMDPALPISIPSDYGSHRLGDAASESESIPTSSGSGKKRTSRAGTRSVSTLSAAQLERKRANDRDAQRAIRQRTKDHIDGLEKTINELRVTQEATEKLLAATQNQNREIMEENAYLRSKLGEAGLAVGMSSFENSVRFQPPQFHPPESSVSQIASSANQSEDVSSTPRSNLSLATSQSSESQHGLWQQSQSHVVQSAPANLENAAMMQIGSNITNWRSHDGLHNAESEARQIQTSSPEQSHIRYTPNLADQDSHWDVKPPAAMFQDNQVPPQYHSANQQQQQSQQYQQSAVASPYTAGPIPSQQSFQTIEAPTNEFQRIAMASPVGYQMPHQQPSLPHLAQYMMPPTNASRAIPHSEVTPQPSIITHTYDPTRVGHQYTQQTQQLPMHPQPQAPPDDHTYPHPQYQP